MKIKKLCKKIGENQILKDISLEFNHTGIVFLMGESGAGKTTLFNVMSGIDSEYEGEIVYEDLNIKYDIQWYRKNILGVIFQDFNLIPALNVKDNILLGAKIAEKKCDDSTYKEIISILQIEHLEKRDIATLSGGERQRVAIARALLRDDRIIFADEPSGNLDTENTRILFNHIKNLSKNRLFIIVSHDREIAKEYGERIIEIKNGEIILDKDISYNSNNKLKLRQETIEKKDKKVKWAFQYSLHSFWNRKRKTFGILFVTTIALLGMMFVLGFTTAIQKEFENVNSEVLENDKFSFNQKNNIDSNINISDELYNELSNMQTCRKIDRFYKESLTVSSSKTSVCLDYEIIDSSDFYIERYSQIEGTLPKKNDEIMIDSIMAENLFNTQKCIGEKVTIQSDWGFTAEVTITAIKNISSKEDGELYIFHNLSEELLKYDMNECVYAYIDEMLGSQVLLNTKEYQNDDILIVGKRAEKSDEIMISDTAVNSIVQLIGSNKLYSLEEIDSGLVNEELEKLLTNSTVNIMLSASLLDIGNYKITGICKAQGDEAYILFSEELTEKTFLNAGIIYLNDISKKSVEGMEEILNKYNGGYEAYSKSKTSILQSKMSIIIMGMSLLTGIIVFVTAIMIHYFFKMSIMERRYEIGVLLSLGNKRSVIKKILIYEQIILAILITAITSIFTITLNLTGIVKLIKINDVEMYRFSGMHLLIIGVLSLVMIVIFSVPGIFRASKGNIVDLLRNKYN